MNKIKILTRQIRGGKKDCLKIQVLSRGKGWGQLKYKKWKDP